ncbi:coq9 [Candida oxycetoniae]|uniref:Ubiquinone biosynthesis protein n=1 Tax=Candida oxycetoniae TaxID=497107 RepID=A0AAI9T139_9ASCO|nr:coq9 [Candida oxycetoniae]KAI3406943.2 coq9 [Candida oxycetoniae]
MIRILRSNRVARVLPIRLYYSSQHIGSNAIVNDNQIESKILTKAVEYIPQYGFDSRAITKAVHDLKYSDSSISILTAQPSGHSLPFQLMLHYLKLKRQELEKFASTSIDPKLSQGEKLKKLITQRLLYNEPIIGKLSQGLSYLIVPYNISSSLEELLNLGDDLAFFAGDESNDFAWYSKRAAICSIYVKSELFMLGDTTQDFTTTKEFVNKRVDEFEKLGNAINDTEQWVGFQAISLLNLIKSQLTRG